MPPKKKRTRTIAVFGTGYVGIVTAATLLSMGYRVICVDVLPEVVESVNKGSAPIHEPGVNRVLKGAIRSGRLMATTDGISAIKKAHISFICVGTPSKTDGGIDLKFVRAVSREIGKGLKKRKGFHVVVVKSTVVPSTTLKVVRPILQKASGKKVGRGFGLACNPEFLREGSALKDSLRPDRIVIGVTDTKSRDEVLSLFEDLNSPILVTDPTTAEMVKYVSNAFLATKVALSNEVANICSAHRIDVYDVMEGVGLDKRIGPLFLRAGAGFGGSCFPKDVRALIDVAHKADVPLQILPSVMVQNALQPLETVDLLRKVLKDLKGKEIALLGVAFKPDTDDVRETRALPIVKALLRSGANVRIYDPNKAAGDGFMALLPDDEKKVKRARTVNMALKGAHGCILQTEWKEFRDMRPSTFKRLMKRPVVIDGRRALDPKRMLKAGVIYRGIGWRNEQGA